MLERTAAGLEARAIQRVLPCPTNRRRALHTAFWQHGASAVELSAIWTVPSEAPSPAPSAESDTVSGVRQHTPNLTAATFVLDFLYPNIANSSLRWRSWSASRPVPTSQRAAYSSNVSEVRNNWRTARQTHYVPPSHVSSLDHEVKQSLEPMSEEAHRMLQKIRTDLRIGHLAEALETFKLAINGEGYSEGHGLEEILAVALDRQNWQVLNEAWTVYYALHCEEGRLELEDRLKPLKTVSNLGALYCAYERWMTSRASRKRTCDPIPSEITEGALEVLRRSLSHMALTQPCPPKYALPILEALDDGEQFDAYIALMMDRFYRKLETWSTIHQLNSVYNIYRQRDLFKPSTRVLRGMFKINYPGNINNLENIYVDWHTAYGDLNVWAFEKYLKLYAHLGDVERVEALWERFVAAFPNVLLGSRAFNSLVNVYAQTGDEEKAERELVRMSEQYGLQPDLDIWNTLLKCYSRTGNYDKLITCFEDLSKTLEPDAYTYAHVMMAHAKRGDTDSAKQLFAASQLKGVPLSKEIALSLVAAYCKSEQVEIAEKLCHEFAARGVTSTPIWNNILRLVGRDGHIEKFYELLDEMKKYDLMWDHDTYIAVFTCLARVGHLAEAHKLLKKAVHERWTHLRPRYFAIVIMGALKLRDHATLDGILKLMDKVPDLPNDFTIAVARAATALRRSPGFDHTRTLVADLIPLFRSLLVIPSLHKDADEKVHVRGDVIQRRVATNDVGRALKLLVECRDFVSAEVLVKLYTELFPQHKSLETLPENMLSALMLAYGQDGNYAKVHELWQQLFSRAVRDYSRPAPASGVYPAYTHALVRPYAVVVQAYRHELNGDGLADSLRQLTDAGFELTSNLWNKAIVALAETGQWMKGLDWCEKKLMPRWRGWKYSSAGQRNEAPEKANPRVLRPTRRTVYALQVEWFTLHKQLIPSAKTSRLLRKIKTLFPRLHGAFMVAARNVKVPMRYMFGIESDLRDRSDTLLRRLSRAELQDVAAALEARASQEHKLLVQYRPKMQLTKDPEPGLTVEELQATEAAVSERLDVARQGQQDIYRVRTPRSLNRRRIVNRLMRREKATQKLLANIRLVLRAKQKSGKVEVRAEKAAVGPLGSEKEADETQVEQPILARVSD